MARRYADDFVVIARTEDEILELREFGSEWLKQETGLELSPGKTTVKRSTQGFDFLGFHLIYLLTDKGNRPKLKIYVSKTYNCQCQHARRVSVKQKCTGTSINTATESFS